MNIKDIKDIKDINKIKRFVNILLHVIEFFVLYIINFSYSFVFYFIVIPYRFLKRKIFLKKQKKKINSFRTEIDHNIIMYSRKLNEKYLKEKNKKNK